MSSAWFTRRVVKPVVVVAALAPLGHLAWRAAVGALGVNPIEEVTLVTGRWTLRLLVATLAVTPVRRLTGWHDAIRLRRPLGLAAFLYGTLHLASYVGLDQFFAWRFILADIAKRPFITAGFAAFVLLVPLAITSTRGWVRRLGRGWARLHRLVYASAVLGVVHYYWKVKADTRDPLVYAAILGGLFAVRLAYYRRGRVVGTPVRPQSVPVDPRGSPVH
jgi:sulfoxide reductase heme-binding subunit YedZ